ncbi:sigma factor-like helix-turn-helix DNA-binding protein [Thermoanaerobacterium thermosaccharolyticum]|nr:sigma factor-like helix-turn-helix DNA-binding protein [Thermoanaerobacterium thermosaccharolyticum]MBE0069828.1 hypothetical protein [Thermoanaerobacterium thermosaccharolyticum]MBE0227508.1 hypothetical protein [Thermoanaerobacterium thermosaccharolyticum]
MIFGNILTIPIGDLFGLTRERIRQIEIKALKKLRRDKSCQKLKEYWQEL